jgi:putative FmdB family regulatory protein
LYAYRCTECGHKFEKIQKFSDEPETECPKCHGVLERPLTAPRLNFKGAGWYINDYASKSSSSESSSSGDGAGAESSAKSDSKSESKADSGRGTKESKPASTSGESKSSTMSLLDPIPSPVEHADYAALEWEPLLALVAGFAHRRWAAGDSRSASLLPMKSGSGGSIN